MLAFGLDSVLDHRGLSPGEIAEAVRARGGVGFAAHPFSTGSERFARLRSLGESMEWQDLESLDGLEVWSFVADNGQELAEHPRGDPLRRAPRAPRDPSAARAT